LGVQRLGFIVTGTIYLAALMWALRVPPIRAVPIAIVMTLLIHYAFYKLLKVPLPWGLLQSIAW
jgi:putative tricarboxylic transport membrane protein